MNKLDEDLSDDYVAGLLKKDAADSSSRFSALGQRTHSGAPKPNTRFLRNIVKEVYSHNAALLAKEEQEKAEKAKRMRAERKMEVQARMKEQSREYGRLCDDGYENGRRRRRDYHSDPEGEERDSKRRRNRSRVRSPDREKRHKSRHRSRDRDRSKTRRHKSHRGDKDRRERDSDKSNSRANDEPTRRGSHEKSSRDSRRHHHHHQRSNHVRAKHHTQDNSLHKRRETHSQSEECSEGPTSDPHEVMIGPVPLPRARGRGASGASAMDARFDEGYDPSQDARPDPDPKVMSHAAIEAYRERQKSKTVGAARMRQGGLPEDLATNWEDRDKKDAESIQWKGKGKVREWDRGKVVGGSGETLLMSPWPGS